MFVPKRAKASASSERIPRRDLVITLRQRENDSEEDDDQEQEEEKPEDDLLEGEQQQQQQQAAEEKNEEQFNRILLRREQKEHNVLRDNEAAVPEFLYPSLNDPRFLVKVAQKQEFVDTQYDGSVHRDIEARANELANAPYELQPHQAFVRNFMSVDTPYNSLLLFHGLGSGKTCSAIGVCEEMRAYLQQQGMSHRRIVIVASDNVQANFRSQLFDERKLDLKDGRWTMGPNCVGAALLREVLPLVTKTDEAAKKTQRTKIVQAMNQLIDRHYEFVGYIKFANLILQCLRETKARTRSGTITTVTPSMQHRLRQAFDGALIVIDEVHNIRKSDEQENKKVAYALETLVKYTEDVRLLLLSATPMYNNYREIIWLLNLMNRNDKRATLKVQDVFDKRGNFKEGGRDLLIRKATGYISFVRGENPYTFPFRVYPKQFAPRRTFPDIPYPTHQLNLLKIPNEDRKRILSLFVTRMRMCAKKVCGACQGCVYHLMMQQLRSRLVGQETRAALREQQQQQQQRKRRRASDSDADEEEGKGEEPEEEEEEAEQRETEEPLEVDLIGYTVLMYPLQAQLMVYPMLLDDNDPRNVKREVAFQDTFAKSMRTTLMQDEVADADDNPDFEMRSQEHGTFVVKEALRGPATQADEAEQEAAFSEEGGEGEGEEEPELEPPRKKKPINVVRGGASGPMIFDYATATGREGLARTMKFEETATTKGNFAYRADTLQQFGRIFNRNEIGKYSVKIAEVLNCLYNLQTGFVAQGVLLVYSNFLDGGLIPMALALEEAGLVRYGGAGKSLFRDRASMPILSARTMQPVARGESPAAYAMITGDARLSPDNQAEVKAATDKANLHGDQIKVVLISRAGAEGIDFKFLRQGHLLDPWYNMNRPEQIFGRCVRNFSHVDLPFDERNVQLFMHASMLQNNVEETADLYMYRVAESKAIQIGHITRILKQTSVDCLLNHGQTNFSQEEMQVTVRLQLSTGGIVKKFKVGDAPFSPSCDYMERCHYDCTPDGKLGNNQDTYSEQFVRSNLDRLLQRIRLLFRLAFFYKKPQLLQLLQVPVAFPLAQIYYALSQLINSPTETLFDKYGRTGRLVNVGEYYLFQPQELLDIHASGFDRRVPPAEKPRWIPLTPVTQGRAPEPPQWEGEETKQAEEKPEQEEELSLLPALEERFATLVTRIQQEEEEAVAAAKEPVEATTAEDDAWVDVLRACKTFLPVRALLAQHLVDAVPLAAKARLLQEVFATTSDPSSLAFLAKQYWSRHARTVENEFGEQLRFVTTLDPSRTPVFWLWQPGRGWTRAGAADTQFLETHQRKPANLHSVVGFLGLDRAGQTFAFKTKVVQAVRDTGARCEEADKKKVLKQLALVLSEADDPALTEQVLQVLQVPEGTTLAALDHLGGKAARLPRKELCVLVETVMRHLDDAMNQRWFLLPEEAIQLGYFVSKKN